MITIPPRKNHESPSFWAAMFDGFRYVNKNRLLIVLLTVPAFLSLLGLPFIVLMPVFARDLLHVGASGLGFLMAGAGLGAVSAALILAARGVPEHRGAYILSCASLFSLCLILFARAHSFWWAFCLLAVMGAMMVGTLTLTNTTLQMTTPPELRGRIMSMYYMAMTGLMPLGSLQAGAIAEVLGARFALAFGGAVCLVYFLTVLASLRRLRKEGRLPQPENSIED